MGERKHQTEARKEKIIQFERKEEQEADRQPSEALTRLSAKVAQPSDIQSLQKIIGNRSVTNMIQRHARRHLDQYAFRVEEKTSGHKTWLDIIGGG